MRTEFDAGDVSRIVKEMALRIAGDLASAGALNVIGIRTRGEVVAARLADLMASAGIGPIGRGVLDITMYRDDLSEIGPTPLVRPTNIHVDISGRPLLLVDDVLFTGRSVRAALNALGDLGRPSVIRLAVLADRGGRELPIQADYVGLKLNDVPVDYRVNVRLTETDGRDQILVEPR